jgi:hypothetical protein
MVILDIDQDFMFDCPSQTRRIEDYVRLYHLQDILDRFGVGKGTPYRLFVDHDEALWDCRYNNYKNIELIHVDRHDDIPLSLKDIEHDRENGNRPHTGNWISHLIDDGRCSYVEWIGQHAKGTHDTQVIETPYNRTSFTLCQTTLASTSFRKSIDLVYYTVSPGFSPTNIDVLEFISVFSGYRLEPNSQLFV